MVVNKVKIASLRSILDSKTYQYCLNECNKVDIENGVSYCMDKNCRATHKRRLTRMRNIRKNARWGAILSEFKPGSIISNNLMPYILLEYIVLTMYDNDIKNYVYQEIGIKARGLITTEQRDKLYKMDEKQVQTIVERCLLITLGLERAETITKSI